MLLGVILIAGFGGFAGAYFLDAAPTAVAAAKPMAKPPIVAGDGVIGPKNMMWVPGGEFLMGSEHRLAQKNERPSHRVRVHGFWMDHTHDERAIP